MCRIGMLSSRIQEYSARLRPCGNDLDRMAAIRTNGARSPRRSRWNFLRTPMSGTRALRIGWNLRRQISLAQPRRRSPLRSWIISVMFVENDERRGSPRLHRPNQSGRRISQTSRRGRFASPPRRCRRTPVLQPGVVEDVGEDRPRPRKRFIHTGRSTMPGGRGHPIRLLDQLVEGGLRCGHGRPWPCRSPAPRCDRHLTLVVPHHQHGRGVETRRSANPPLRSASRLNGPRTWTRPRAQPVFGRSEQAANTSGRLQRRSCRLARPAQPGVGPGQVVDLGADPTDVAPCPWRQPELRVGVLEERIDLARQRLRRSNIEGDMGGVSLRQRIGTQVGLQLSLGPPG